MRALRANPIRSSAARVAAAIDDGARVRDLRFELSVPAAATGDFALPLGLLPAMALRAPLQVDSPVDAGLLDRQERIQAQVATWDSMFRPVAVSASERLGPEATPAGIGLFFSGGLDSFCTLETRRDEITHLILVHGFDVPLDDLVTRERITRMARDVAEERGLELIEVVTDAKLQMIRLVPWHWYHGGLLAAIAHALEEHLSRALISSTFAARFQFPWGQDPAIDPLWSTSRVLIETTDPDLVRLEKCEIIADSELAMRWLRVCFQRPAEWNCGRCMKCLRTMIDLAVCDRLVACRTLPDEIDLDAVRSMVIPYEATRGAARLTVEAARRDPRHRELADALEFAIRRSRARVARSRVRRIPAGLVHRAQRRGRRLRKRI